MKYGKTLLSSTLLKSEIIGEPIGRTDQKQEKKKTLYLKD